MLQVSLKQQLIAYYLRTLNAESEAREHVNLGAFLLDTAKEDEEGEGQESEVSKPLELLKSCLEGNSPAEDLEL